MSSAQSTEAPAAENVDSEAQAVDNPANTQGTQSIRVQTQTTFGPTSNQCGLACSCVCHRSYRLKSPSILESIMGSILIRVNGLYGINPVCNEFSCSRRSSASIRIAYRFPEWFLDRIVFSVIEKNCYGRTTGTLMTPRIVPNDSAIFSLDEAGNIGGVAKLFDQGSASPDDIQDQRGFTPLHVSRHPAKVASTFGGTDRYPG